MSPIASIRNSMGKIGGFAVFDVGATVIGAGIISDKMDWPYVKTLIALWGTGELLHIIFGVKTPFTRIILS